MAVTNKEKGARRRLPSWSMGLPGFNVLRCIPMIGARAYETALELLVEGWSCAKVACPM